MREFLNLVSNIPGFAASSSRAKVIMDAILLCWWFCIFICGNGHSSLLRFIAFLINSTDYQLSEGKVSVK